MNIKKTGVEKLDAEAASKNLYGITVPIITAETTEEEGRNNPRAPFYAVYKFILDDLASAEELLSDYQRPTKNLPCTPVVHGLMARMWLEMGSRFELYPEDLNTLNNNTDLNIASKETCFTKAAEYARKVINESGAMPLTEKEWFGGDSYTTGFNSVLTNSWVWGSIMKLGDVSANMNIEVIHTGCLPLDAALGVGGVPRGRIVEIFGPESSGKTTVALHIVAEAQKTGGVAAFIDAEHALDPVYAKKLGVDIDNLLISQPDNGEQALEIADALVRSGAIDVVVVDSVAALVPKAEIEGDMGDSHVGLQARLMSQAMRKLTGIISKSRTTAIFINQIREKVGVMFGNPETTTGGRALKFYASIRLDVRKIDTIKQGNDPVGSRTRIKVVKNKVAPPFKQAEFDIMYGEGISREGSLIDMGTAFEILDKSGTWYSYQGTRLGQGKENVKAYLKEHADTALEIENKIREKLFVQEEQTEEKVEEPTKKSKVTADNETAK